MNKLITGGTGLIGSAFKSGTKINSSIDLRDSKITEWAISSYQPEVVIHTAARVGGLGANLNYPAEFYIDNIRMNTNVIDSCHKYGVKKLVVFLSTCIFPDDVEYPIDETKIELGPPHYSNYAYAYAKRMAEIQVRAYNQQYGTEYFSVIPCNLYGPNDNFNIQNGHVIPTLIHKCYLAKKNGTPFEVWGDGTPLREFLYSEDVAEIIDLLIEKYQDTTPVIISNTDQYSIKDAVDLIVKYMDFKGELKWLKEKPNGQFRKPSSNKKLLSIIGDYKFTPLEDGIKKTVDWFNKNYEKARK